MFFQPGEVERSIVIHHRATRCRSAQARFAGSHVNSLQHHYRGDLATLRSSNRLDSPLGYSVFRREGDSAPASAGKEKSKDSQARAESRAREKPTPVKGLGLRATFGPIDLVHLAG